MRKAILAALLGTLIILILAGCAAPVADVGVTGVSLNVTGLGLVVGETETLVATVVPTDSTDKGVSWKSDDDAIASVDKNGVVTGVGEGWTTITVTTDDGGYEASCGVVVGTLPVSEVKLEPATLELKVGNSYQLSWTVLPEFASDKDVTWASSDDKVVSMVGNEPGKIFAVKAGSATITVTTRDGGHIDTCKVDVIP